MPGGVLFLKLKVGTILYLKNLHLEIDEAVYEQSDAWVQGGIF